MRFHLFRALALIGLAVAAPACWAQAPADNPDWAEVAAPPPPAYDAARVIPLAMPVFTSLAFGVDPKTVSIGADGVVRYVIVATPKNGGGPVNAIYEGLRCDTGTAKTYARNAGSGWNPVTSPDWREIMDGASINMATLAFARAGGCDGHARPRTVEELLQSLRRPYSAGYM